MRARLVVFPLKGRTWCFSRSVDPPPLTQEAASSSQTTPSTLKQLWANVSSSDSTTHDRVELLVDFVSSKMDKAWRGMEKAPPGSLKNRIHGLGLKLLARVRPSEIFLKSITKEVTLVEVAYPPSLNARLVRRRLRHIAMSGAIIHKKYLYVSAAALPLTSALSVLPLPNIPFFWVLFRSYSHWRAKQGSEKLLELVSDESHDKTSPSSDGREHPLHDDSKHEVVRRLVSHFYIQFFIGSQRLFSEYIENEFDSDPGSDEVHHFSLSILLMKESLTILPVSQSKVIEKILYLISPKNTRICQYREE